MTDIIETNLMKNIIMEPVLLSCDEISGSSISFSTFNDSKNIESNEGELYSENIISLDDINTVNQIPHVSTLTQKVIPKNDEFDTGDILLFSDKTFIPSRIIEYCSGSKYSHAGIILKDPTYIRSDLKGLYILESTGLTDLPDVEEHKLKTGVQIRKLEDIYNEYDGAIFWRKLHISRDENFFKTMNDIHKSVHGLPYDFNIIDWVEALFNVQFQNVQITKTFICSALVTYIYLRLGLVENDTPWTIIRPKDLGTEFDNEAQLFNVRSTDKSRIKFTNNCLLDKEIIIKSYDSYVHYVYHTY